jgi:hypothetical protein
MFQTTEKSFGWRIIPKGADPPNNYPYDSCFAPCPSLLNVLGNRGWHTGYHDLSDIAGQVVVYGAKKPLVPCGYLQGPDTERSPHLCPVGI